MKITNEEVARLLRVVSEPLRSRWEIKNLNGKSLLDLQKSRERAVAEVSAYKKKTRHGGQLMFAVSVLFCFGSLLFVGWLHTQTVQVRFMIASPMLTLVALFLCLVWHWNKKINTTSETVEQCDRVFEKLGRSVDSLNPLGTGNSYHDLITEELVNERMTTLAFRILDAEANFDECRHNSNTIRFDVIHSGNWVEKCQASFERAWYAATNDFVLELDKPAIFKNAAAELARNNAEHASRIAG